MTKITTCLLLASVTCHYGCYLYQILVRLWPCQRLRLQPKRKSTQMLIKKYSSLHVSCNYKKKYSTNHQITKCYFCMTIQYYFITPVQKKNYFANLSHLTPLSMPRHFSNAYVQNTFYEYMHTYTVTCLKKKKKNQL